MAGKSPKTERFFAAHQMRRLIAATRVCCGYRRTHVLLRCEGRHVKAKYERRLYREMDLQLRGKTPGRQIKAALRDDRKPAMGSNEIWAMDF